MGNEANLVIAFNEQVPYGRIDQQAYKPGTIMLLESKWGEHSSEVIREKYRDALADFRNRGYNVVEIPMEKECLKIISNPRRGKNMWVLGMLSSIYHRDLQLAEDQIRQTFRKKSDTVIQSNIKLLHAGYAWTEENLDIKYEVPAVTQGDPLVVMNGNEALAMGILAAGIEVCSMYPITPATSTTHSLAECIQKAGGVIHQAEDEISAVGFAIGSSYAGKTAVTITSGPGIALMSPTRRKSRREKRLFDASKCAKAE